MHFEMLVEDASGKKMLEVLVPKLIGAGPHTFSLHSYKGLGEIPKDLKSAAAAKSQMLLNDLPRALRGYGAAHAASQEGFGAAVVVVCDLDARDEKGFRAQLECVLAAIEDKRPNAHFCLAIEEGEAWLLGDRQAVRAAYPGAKEGVLKNYRQDSICGTREKLADAVYPGGHRALKRAHAVGAEKYQWAAEIAPLMEPGRNRSLSFGCFVKCLADLAGPAGGQGA